MLNSNSGATQFPEIGWGHSLYATPNQRRDAVDNALWVGKPVKDIPHISRDPAKPRNAAHKAGCRSEDPIQAFNSTSRESFIYRATVIEARYYKGMNKGRCSRWGEGAGHHPKLEKNTIKKESKTKRLSLILLCVVFVVIIVAGEVIVACRSIITMISNLLREQGILVITQ